jgi:hypothetical protein
MAAPSRAGVVLPPPPTKHSTPTSAAFLRRSRRPRSYITNSRTKFVAVVDEFSPREDLLAKVGGGGMGEGRGGRGTGWATAPSRGWRGRRSQRDQPRAQALLPRAPPHLPTRPCPRVLAAPSPRPALAPARPSPPPGPRRARPGQAFKAMHHAFVDAASSPFYTFGLPLTSLSFAEAIATIVGGYMLALQQQQLSGPGAAAAAAAVAAAQQQQQQQQHPPLALLTI